MDDNGRIFLFLNDFREILLTHVGEVQGKDAAGIGPGREDALGVDEQRIALQEEAHRRVRVLERLVHRVVRGSPAPAIAAPVIDGSGHVAQ